METEMEFCKTEIETYFFSGSGNGNGTTFFGGTNAGMEFLFLTHAEFLFFSDFAWSI
jgi:hypothetical protein